MFIWTIKHPYKLYQKNKRVGRYIRFVNENLQVERLISLQTINVYYTRLLETVSISQKLVSDERQVSTHLLLFSTTMSLEYNLVNLGLGFKVRIFSITKS